MINSLSKDSHITQSCRLQKSTHSSERRVYNSMSNTAPVNNSSIIVRNPAEISFSGISSYKLADTALFRALIQSAKDSLGKDSIYNEKIAALVNASIKIVRNVEPDAKLNAPSFASEQKETLCKIIEQTKDFNAKELAETDIFKTLVQNARAFLGKDSKDKEIKELIDASIAIIRAPKFASEQKETLNEVIEQTKIFMTDEFVTKDPKKETETAKNIKTFLDEFWAKRENEFKSNIREAVGHLPKLENKEKPKSIYKNESLQGFLNLATGSPAVFSALFAVGLTCFLRPAAIMALPADKKNKDDKKYAAGHSIASGIIGYIMSLILFDPIAKGIQKVANDPDKFAKKSSYLKDKPAAAAAGTYIKLLPEAILAAPRAIVTVALIPVILKYVFGWEKKKPEIKTTALPVAQNPKDRVVFQNIAGGVK